MKRSKTTGWQQVYLFTFQQLWKSKAVRTMTIILCAIFLLSMPILQVITMVTSKDTTSNIKTVYIVDESGLSQADYTVIAKNQKQYRNISFNPSDKTAEELTKELSEGNKETVLLHITMNQGTYNLEFVKSPDSSISDTELSTFSNYVVECFDANRIQFLGISKEQTDMINAEIITEVNTIGAAEDQPQTNGNQEQENKKEAMSMSQYSMALAVTTISIMFLAFAGESIASSIITEKSTRVIELLMTSIRPLAVIIGKVLAVLSVNILQFLLFIACFIGSCFIKKSLYPSEGLLPGPMNSILSADVFQNVTPVTVILSVLIFFGGFLLFSLLAGLTGATVSRVEELAEGIMVYNACMIIGAYLSIAVSIFEISGSSNRVLAFVSYLLPISAPFVTPMHMLFGRTSLLWGFASLFVLVLCIIGLFLFTAKIYETLILHQGNRLKLKDLLTISKQVKEEA